MTRKFTSNSYFSIAEGSIRYIVQETNLANYFRLIMVFNVKVTN